MTDLSVLLAVLLSLTLTFLAGEVTVGAHGLYLTLPFVFSSTRALWLGIG